MNRAQIETIETALLEALTYLQEHPPTPAGFLGTQPVITQDRNHEEQQRIIDHLRSALTLLRVWKSLVRASTGDVTSPGVLPGQLPIPFTEPEKK